MEEGVVRLKMDQGKEYMYRKFSPLRANELFID